MNLKLGDKQQVEHAKALVILMDDHRASRRRAGQKIRMPDEERASVAHVDRVRPKRPGVVYVDQLLDSHTRDCTAPAGWPLL
jgi:hypothetical protein